MGGIWETAWAHVKDHPYKFRQTRIDSELRISLPNFDQTVVKFGQNRVL